MPYASHVSQNPTTQLALAEAAGAVTAQLGGQTPDLSFLFVSASHLEQLDQLGEKVHSTIGGKVLIGCSGESIAGGGVEFESGSVLSLWCAILPGAELETFHATFEKTPDGPVCIGFPDPPDSIDELRALFLVGEPMTCSVETLLGRMRDDFPGVPLIGGMASGATSESKCLFRNGELFSDGAVGVIVRGGPRIQSVVSQGCRPIGMTFVVTKVTDNVVLELGGKPALSQLEQTYAGLSEEDRHLIRRGLHLGAAMNEHKSTLGRGDFLISNVLGADRESGAIAIGNFLRIGQTVQFHVRDSDTADEDLRHLLAVSGSFGEAKPGGALLFSCNGRGTNFFPGPNHDASVVQELCGPLPLAGFFARGEFGPVGGRNYIHGFTASIALFE